MTVPVDHDFHDFVKAQNRTRQGCWMQWMLNQNLDLPTPDFSPTMSNHNMQRLYRQHILRKSIRSRGNTLPASPHPTTFRTRHALSFSESSENRPNHRTRLSPISGTSGSPNICIERLKKVSPTKALESKESRTAKKDLARAATLAACLPDNDDLTESENEAKDDAEEDKATSELEKSKKNTKKSEEAAIKVVNSPDKIEELPLKELRPTPMAKERTRRASARLQKLREMKDKLTVRSKKLPIKRDVFSGSLMPSRKARSTKKSDEKPMLDADEPFEILDELSDVKKDPEKLEEAESTSQEKSVEKSKAKSDVEMLDLSKIDKNGKEKAENKITTENNKMLSRKRNSSDVDIVTFMSPTSSANTTPVKMAKMTSPRYSLPVPDLQLPKPAPGTPIRSSSITSNSASSPMSRSPRVSCLPGLPASKISAYLDNYPLPKLVTAPNPVFIPTDLFPEVIDDEPVLTDEIYDILEDLRINPPKPQKMELDNIPTDDLDVGTLDQLEAAIDIKDLIGYKPPLGEEPTDFPEIIESSGELPLPATDKITAEIPLVVRKKEPHDPVISSPETSVIMIPPKMPESPINVLSRMLQKMMPGCDLQTAPVSSQNNQTPKTTTIAVHSIAPITTIIQVDSIEKLKKGEAVIGRKIIPSGINAFAVAVPNSLTSVNLTVKHEKIAESKLEDKAKDKFETEIANKEENKKVLDENDVNAREKTEIKKSECKKKEMPETKEFPKNEEKKDQVCEEAEKEEGPVIYTSPVGHRTRSLSSVSLKPKRRIIRRKSHSEDDKENASKITKSERKSKNSDSCLTENTTNVNESAAKNMPSNDEQKKTEEIFLEKNIEENLQKKCSFTASKTTTKKSTKTNLMQASVDNDKTEISKISSDETADIVKDVKLQKEPPLFQLSYEHTEAVEKEKNNDQLNKSGDIFFRDEKKESVDSTAIKTANSLTVKETSEESKKSSDEKKLSEAEIQRVRNKRGRILSFENLDIKNEEPDSKKEVLKVEEEKLFTPRRSSRVSKPREAFDNPNYNRRSIEARDLNRSLAALVKKTDKVHAPIRRKGSKKMKSAPFSKEKTNAKVVNNIKNTLSNIKLDEVKVKPLSDSSMDGSSSCSEDYLSKSPEANCPTQDENIERARRKSTVKKSKQLESRERAEQRAELKAKKKKKREEAHRELFNKPPPGKKPFKCRYCAADFMTKSGIHYHQKLATCETTRCPFFIL